jgi:hypothetical protein
MAGDKALRYNGAGALEEFRATDSSAGAGSAGDFVGLDANGRVAANMMPTGVGADVKSIVASEALAANDLVNIWDDSGTPKARKADASAANASKKAMGYVTSAVSSGAAGDVYFEGELSGQSGLTAGDAFLSATPGDATSTAPTTSGHCVQRVGFATSATTVNVEFAVPIVLA